MGSGSPSYNCVIAAFPRTSDTLLGLKPKHYTLNSVVSHCGNQSARDIVEFL